MRNIFEINLKDLSMGQILRWNLKMSPELIYSRKKLSAKKASTLSDNLRKFTLKFARFSI